MMHTFDPDAFSISYITVRGDGLGTRFHEEIRARADKIFSEHGTGAFESTKQAAAIHEAGHVVVRAARDGRVRRAYIKRDGRHWIGYTEYRGRLFQLDPATTTAGEYLNAARDVYAGIAAEKLFDDDLRHGSSLDEVVVAHWLASEAARLTEAPDPTEYGRANVSSPVGQTLLKHRVVHNELAAYLLRHTEIKGPPLRAFVGRIRAGITDS